MKIIFLTLAILVLIAGLALLAVDKEVAIAVLVASATLAILGLAAAQEENHRKLVELMERMPPQKGLDCSGGSHFSAELSGLSVPD